MSAPPVPQMCAHRPRRGGLVVPYVSFEHNNAVTFGALDPRKRTRAFVNRLCQICERPLHERFYVLLRPQDVSVGYAPEPGLHPPCMVYSEQACPMLSGAVTTYREGGVIARHPAGRPCDDPNCSCPVTASSEEDERRSGSAADDWDAWMLPLAKYQLRHTAQGEPIGIELPAKPLRIRRIRVSPARQRALALLEALQELGL
ncbi:hypothetical protein ACFV3R_09940 [Streptomyces sp. NPDC059740]|uniref:hypothetical protein n=1 Tax=Streptomyces sp. NPDC059740 TaxID=3346926 RepID=UPI0036617FEA